MRRVAASLFAVVVLAACGSGSSTVKSGDPSASPSTGASALPAGTTLPTASGSFGEKPELTFPKSGPPATALSQVLSEGKGEAVAKGDLLAANYLGQIWSGNDGKVFDNSYDRGEPATFPIGVGKVIPGWDELLVGQQVGSRVLLSIPPDKGYGESGNTQAGIKGTDTLVFVVDIIGSYGKDATGQPDAAPADSAPAGITVTGALGSAPTLAVATGTTPPTEPSATVLAKGSGKAVGAGLLIVQYVATSYAGESAGSTWENGTPEGVSVGGSGNASPFDAIKGTPLGSRVLLLLPGANEQPAVAVVVDLVAQPGAK